MKKSIIKTSWRELCSATRKHMYKKFIWREWNFT